MLLDDILISRGNDLLQNLSELAACIQCLYCPLHSRTLIEAAISYSRDYCTLLLPSSKSFVCKRRRYVA